MVNSYPDPSPRRDRYLVLVYDLRYTIDFRRIWRLIAACGGLHVWCSVQRPCGARLNYLESKLKGSLLAPLAIVFYCKTPIR